MLARSIILSLVSLPFALVLACSGDDGDGSNGAIDAAPSTIDAANAADAAPPTGNNVVPNEATALNAYLVAGNYDQFAAEPAMHATAGPHMSMVRSFFNSTLDDSLRAGGGDHPTGSAVVKELYNGGGQLNGWAVMVKTANSAATPAGDWYYYEVLSATPGEPPVLEGNGVGGCAGCHGAGTDYIRSSYP